MVRYSTFLLFYSILSSTLCLAQTVELRTYYDEEKTIVKEIYTLKEKNSNVLQGPYTSFFQGGNLKTVGQYFENSANGLWEFYYDGGELRMRGNINNGKNNGYWEYFYKNGETSMEGEILDNVREGHWKMYYDNGSLKSEGSFLQGQKDGLWKYYFEKGDLQAIGNYTEGGGNYKEYFPSGNIKMEGIKQKEKKQGIWVYYYEDGTIKGEGEFKNDLKTGNWKYYGEEGNLISEGNYRDGEPNGSWIDYHENGSISAQGNYSIGQKNGFWKLFYDDGTSRGEGTFENGTGEYFEYYKNGQIKLKGNIVNGTYEGEWLYYYENGEIEGRANFSGGVGDYIGYFTEGKIKMKGSLRNNERVGIWELFKEDGNLAGYYKPYNEDGKNTLWIASESDQQRQFVSSQKKVGSYKYKKSKFDYFDPQINEFRAIIVNYNPLAPALNTLPIGIEYYNQERLGHELLFIVVREPFFRKHMGLNLGTEHREGFEAALRQKLYNDKKRTGIPYFGHEIRYSNVNHLVKTEDQNNPGNILKLENNESKYEYSLFIGNRFFKAPEEGGMTLDAYIGAGIGYREYSKNFEPSEQNVQFFDDLPTSNISFAFRLGLNLGFAIRVKR